VTLRRAATAGLVGVLALVAASGAYLWVTLRPLQHRYCGRGTFVDFGWRASSKRFVLTLDSYPLRDLSTKPAEYVVGTLPPVDMWLGLRFILRGRGDEEAIRQMPVRAKVTDTRSGKVLFAYEGPLDSLDSAFVPQTSGGGNAAGKVLLMYSNVAIAESRFSLGPPFLSCRPDAYQVEVAFLAPVDAPARETPFELVLFGGGWK
jgi:hypothetical protein